MKKILFLSALDFKEKSIQVIKNTPIAFAEAGWDVDYIVARDLCSRGNYYYEREVRLEDVNVERIYWPLSAARATKSRLLALMLSKLSGIIVIWNLYRIAAKKINNTNYDVIYGYEMHGVLALGLLKLFGLDSKIKTISRFQGSFLYEMICKKQYLRLLFNFDQIIAMRLQTNLLIMTNDGTHGDRAVKFIKGRKEYNMYFATNGVDQLCTDVEIVDAINRTYRKNGNIIFLTVSRLVGWKRVDRSLDLVYRMQQISPRKIVLLIVGDGPQRAELERRASVLGILENVVFVGALKNSAIGSYYAVCDFFLSMYDSSNVGNPLLEAIRSHCVVVTLNNGDTGSWIQHKKNGLIYDIDSNFIDRAAVDICEVFENQENMNDLVAETRRTASKKLITWRERLSEEIRLVSNLLKPKDADD